MQVDIVWDWTRQRENVNEQAISAQKGSKDRLYISTTAFTHLLVQIRSYNRDYLRPVPTYKYPRLPADLQEQIKSSNYRAPFHPRFDWLHARGFYCVYIKLPYLDAGGNAQRSDTVQYTVGEYFRPISAEYYKFPSHYCLLDTEYRVRQPISNPFYKQAKADLQRLPLTARKAESLSPRAWKVMFDSDGARVSLYHVIGDAGTHTYI